MAKLINKYSSLENKIPVATGMSAGEIAVNIYENKEFLSIKNSASGISTFDRTTTYGKSSANTVNYDSLRLKGSSSATDSLEKGTNSATLGQELQTENAGEVAVGRYNKSTQGQTVFSVGAGTGAGASRSNVLEVTTGKVIADRIETSEGIAYATMDIVEDNEYVTAQALNLLNSNINDLSAMTEDFVTKTDYATDVNAGIVRVGGSGLTMSAGKAIANVDGTTIQINGDGKLVAIGGGGGGSVTPGSGISVNAGTVAVNADTSVGFGFNGSSALTLSSVTVTGNITTTGSVKGGTVSGTTVKGDNGQFTSLSDDSGHSYVKTNSYASSSTAGVVKVSGGSGLEMVSGSSPEIKDHLQVKVDGSTIQINGNGQLVAISGGGGSSVTAGSGISVNAGTVAVNPDTSVGFGFNGSSALTLSSVTVSGDITTTGTVSGVTVSGTTVKGGSIVSTGSVSATGDITTTAGTVSGATVKGGSIVSTGSVSATGDITTTGGTVSGVTVSGTTVKGGTVSGTTVKGDNGQFTSLSDDSGHSYVKTNTIASSSAVGVVKVSGGSGLEMVAETGSEITDQLKVKVDETTIHINGSGQLEAIGGGGGGSVTAGSGISVNAGTVAVNADTSVGFGFTTGSALTLNSVNVSGVITTTSAITANGITTSTLKVGKTIGTKVSGLTFTPSNDGSYVDMSIDYTNGQLNAMVFSSYTDGTGSTAITTPLVSIPKYEAGGGYYSPTLYASRSTADPYVYASMLSDGYNYGVRFKRSVSFVPEASASTEEVYNLVVSARTNPIYSEYGFFAGGLVSPQDLTKQDYSFTSITADTYSYYGQSRMKIHDFKSLGQTVYINDFTYDYTSDAQNVKKEFKMATSISGDSSNILSSTSVVAGMITLKQGNAEGTYSATGGPSSSDARLKHNIEDITSENLDKIKNVKLKQYEFNDSDKLRFGAIAQDVESAGITSLVSESSNGYKGLIYQDLLVLKIAYLERELEKLTEKIERLEEKA